MRIDEKFDWPTDTVASYVARLMSILLLPLRLLLQQSLANTKFGILMFQCSFSSLKKIARGRAKA